jgi:hypothetical protein
MIHDFNNGTVGWTDWNILLDQNGGPVMKFLLFTNTWRYRTGALIYTPIIILVISLNLLVKVPKLLAVSRVEASY